MMPSNSYSFLILIDSSSWKKNQQTLAAQTFTVTWNNRGPTLSTVATVFLRTKKINDQERGLFIHPGLHIGCAIVIEMQQTQQCTIPFFKITQKILTTLTVTQNMHQNGGWYIIFYFLFKLQWVDLWIFPQTALQEEKLVFTPELAILHFEKFFLHKAPKLYNIWDFFHLKFSQFKATGS